MSEDILAGWELRLGDAMLNLGQLRPVGPASYDPDRDVWVRSYSDGEADGNQLATVQVEVRGRAVLKAQEDGQAMMMAETIATEAVATYRRKLVKVTPLVPHDTI